MSDASATYQRVMKLFSLVGLGSVPWCDVDGSLVTDDIPQVHWEPGWKLESSKSG